MTTDRSVEKSLQLEEMFWKPTAHAVVGLHLGCTDSSAESESSRCCTAFVSLEFMNQCIAHTAVSTVNGEVEGKAVSE